MSILDELDLDLPDDTRVTTMGQVRALPADVRARLRVGFGATNGWIWGDADEWGSVHQHELALVRDAPPRKATIELPEATVRRIADRKSAAGARAVAFVVVVDACQAWVAEHPETTP